MYRGLPDLLPTKRGVLVRCRLVTTGGWVMQNPMFAGQAAVMAYLAEEKASIAVAVTFEPEAFDADGNARNEADQLFRELGVIVAPDHAPPISR
jgi:hypothetical protein